MMNERLKFKLRQHNKKNGLSKSRGALFSRYRSILSVKKEENYVHLDSKDLKRKLEKQKEKKN